MARHTIITLDMGGVERLAAHVDALRVVMSGQMNSSAADVVNHAAQQVYVMARERIRQGINLDDAYVQKHMSVVPATASRLQASIVASGARESMTRLAHYDAKVKIAPMQAKRHRGTGSMRRLLGIPQGYKQIATTVQVRRGAPKTAEYMFMLPLGANSKTAHKVGVFTRKGKKITQRYGPSVYQLFAFQLPQLEDVAADELQTAFNAQVDYWVEEAFA